MRSERPVSHGLSIAGAPTPSTETKASGVAADAWLLSRIDQEEALARHARVCVHRADAASPQVLTANTRVGGVSGWPAIT